MSDDHKRPDSKCQQRCSEVGIGEDKISEWYECFCLFDKDGNGLIDDNELAVVMRGLGQNPTDDDISAMIQEADRTNDGKVNFSEFIEMMINKGYHANQPEDELLEAFKVFDVNGDGYVSATELKGTMEKLGESMSNDEVEDMMQTADIDGDGKINYDEFVSVMMAKC